MMKKKVTIIVLTWNGLDYTKPFLDSLWKNTEYDNYEVVVVDNKSTDGTVEYLEKLENIHLIKNDENMGFVRGNNVALKQIKDGDVVLLNNDMLIEQKNWLERLSEVAYEDEKNGVIGCRLVNEKGQFLHAGTYIYPETFWGQQIGGGQKDLGQYGDENREVQGIVFACAYIKREVLDAIGGLNEAFFSYFEDRIGAEIRLPEAIDRKLLSPFQYFAVTDNIDLSKVKWIRKGYDIAELSNVYTNDDLRVSQIVNSLNKYITDINEIIGLGFCVSIEHAIFMAKRFNELNIPSIALTSKSTIEERNKAKENLVNGNIKFIFVVDLYNEGVDIPEVNTILFLRPTESLTVFLQQLWRGLRLSEGKECLTVLDFVGQAHKNYNFEEKFRALIGKSNRSVKDNIENGFLTLPKGCYIQLEKQAKEYILRNIKSSVNNKNKIINLLRNFKNESFAELTLENFLNHYELSLVDFYGKSGDRSFARMCVMAGVKEDFNEENEFEITKKLRNLFHINSRRLIEFFNKIIDEEIDIYNVNNEEKLMLNMMYYTFYNNCPEKENLNSLQEGLERLLKNKNMMAEVKEILKYNYHKLGFVDKRVELGFDCPMDLHCNYTRDQIMAALDYFNGEKKPAFREGVKYFADKK